MRFEDAYVSAAKFFALGRDLQTGGHYLAIPVANRLANYHEYYRITPEQFEQFRSDQPGRRSTLAAGFRGHDIYSTCRKAWSASSAAS